jgi:hypothetical protein
MRAIVLLVEIYCPSFGRLMIATSCLLFHVALCTSFAAAFALLYTGRLNPQTLMGGTLLVAVGLGIAYANLQQQNMRQCTFACHSFTPYEERLRMKPLRNHWRSLNSAETVLQCRFGSIKTILPFSGYINGVISHFKNANHGY